MQRDNACAENEMATRLHERALVWDNHVCIAFEHTGRWLHELERYRSSGVNIIAINIGDADIKVEKQFRMASVLLKFIRNNADKYRLVEKVGDIELAQRHGQLGIFFNVEGFYAMGEQLSLLSLYHKVGVRWALLVYNRENAVAGGCHDDCDKGLTPYGFRVVEEMDRLGIIKCCSHMGYRSARDVLEVSSKPTIFSHSNPRALCDHDRNIPDDLIKACTNTDGIIGINGVALFHRDHRCDTETLVHCIDYLVQLVGPRHVALGLDQMIGDFSGSEQGPPAQDYWPKGNGYDEVTGTASPEHIPQITAKLVARGYLEEDIRGILGENLLRVASAVW